MVKILLVYEDFNELTLTESYLKKVGFDVVGISNERLIQDQILSFNPEILVVHGQNIKVSSFSVGQKLKEFERSHKIFHGKVVIVLPRGVRPGPSEMIKMKLDAMVEAPVDPEKLIHILCRLAAIPIDPILEKWRRVMVKSGTTAGVDKNSAGGASWKGKIPIEDKSRSQHYEELLNLKNTQLDPQKTSHNKQDLKEAQRDLKKDWNFEEIEKQDELKRQFAEALFRKR